MENGRFIRNPSEEVVEEIIHWFGFLTTDPLRFEADEIHHLVSGAYNVLLVEGAGTGKGRMKQALEEAKSMEEMLFAFEQYANDRMFDLDEETQERVQHGLDLFTKYFKHLWI